MPRHNTTTWQFEVFKMAEPDGIVAVVKHCWLLYKEEEAAEKDH